MLCTVEDLLRRATVHAQDDGLSVHLRVATAQILGPHLRSLKLVSTGSGQVCLALMFAVAAAVHLAD